MEQTIWSVNFEPKHEPIDDDSTDSHASDDYDDESTEDGKMMKPLKMTNFCYTIKIH